MYRAAIIGLGKIAWRYDSFPDSSGKISRTHARAYLLHPQVELSAGSSINEIDREGFYQAYKAQVFENYEEMLGTVEPDIVSICTPVESHFEQLRACLDRRIKMVWLEKPPVLSLKQLESIFEYQQKTNRKTKILVGYQRRYSQTFVKLKEMLDKGLIGELRNILVTYSRGIVENGSHYLDIVSYLLGDPAGIKLETMAGQGGSENPSFRLLPLQGPPVFFIGMDLPYHCLDIVITGTQGRASVLHGGRATRWEERREQELYPGYYHLREMSQSPFGAGGLENAMNVSLEDLIDAFENNRQPVSSLESSKIALSILDKIHKIGSQIQ